MSRIIRYFSSSVLLLVLFACQPVKENPRVIQGVLDLRNWDFQTDGSVSLDGDWEFYWNSLLTKENDTKLDPSKTYIKVPAKWDKGRNVPTKYPSYGFASYRAKILLPGSGSQLSVKIASISSSYVLFINGKEISRGGSIGNDESSSNSGYHPGVFSFISPGSELEIVLHVANYRYSNGSGIWNSIRLGSNSEIQQLSLRATMLDSITFGTLFVMSLYHFTFYLMRRRDPSALFFAILCLCIALRVAFYGERIFFNVFPIFQNYEFAVRGELLFLFLLLPGTILYVQSVFKDQLKKDKFLNIIFYLSIPLVLSAVILPTKIYTHSFFVNALEIQMIAVLAYLFFRLAFMSFQAIDGARICFFSLLVNLITVANDILYLNKFIDSFYLVPYGVLALVLSQCVLLASRFSKGFLLAEDLGEELKKLNINLEQIVVERTENLNESLKLLRGDLSLAKKLQQKTLPTLDLNDKKVSIHPYYLPMSEIGGDYYDVFELEPGYFRLFLVDATGHGVQAALLTMTIKAEFESLKFTKEEPSKVLELLNKACCQKYRSINIIFSAVLADIDLNNNTLYYSSAGHPPQVLKQKQEEADYLYSRGPIIGLKKEATYKNVKVSLRPGNRIFFFSDGIFEEFDQEKREFGENRVLSLLSKDVGLREVAEGLISELQIFVGPRGFQDDVTLLAVEVH
ncbi:SpoIIE family protein phosphatase [Leptospira sarikeiensis]|uniref:Protein phosphatase n=1 Tax=Leptospira sarikeiensis TaxID=2484943 RepID=A0A4R9K7H7_9LEPT|nr:SpoIIE family protein phosphatase [Leptospira sarikeiensis]TGL61376.1 protein phosphatase [Leptospira sarikeiensis]